MHESAVCKYYRFVHIQTLSNKFKEYLARRTMIKLIRLTKLPCVSMGTVSVHDSNVLLKMRDAVTAVVGFM